MFKRFPFIHNHGDFVHLDALRDWLRGVVSLESFLKSKDDKAIIKDMHFTDETTSVDYIDTKDDTEKTETLCEYLTSDVVDGSNPNQFNKVDKIKFWKNKHGETIIGVREKESKKERSALVCTNIPVAYDATDNYATSQKVAHIGVSENGVKIYNDETLQKAKEYKFPNGLIYPAGETYTSEDTTTFYKIGLDDDGITLYNDDNSEERRIRFGGSSIDFVFEKDLPDVDPFISVEDKTGGTSLQLHKANDFRATIIHNTVIDGQIDYALSGGLQIEAGKYVVLQLNHGSNYIIDVGFSKNVYPKYAEVPHNTKGLITQITNVGGYGIQGGSPTFLTIYNQTEDTVTVENLHFTF